MKLDCYKNVSICLADSEAVFMFMHLSLMIQGQTYWGDNFYFPCYQLELELKEEEVASRWSHRNEALCCLIPVRKGAQTHCID